MTDGTQIGSGASSSHRCGRGTSGATLYRMVQRGELPTVRIGSAVRVPVSAIERWLADQIAGQGGGFSSMGSAG
jgi:excisionase family DNA binding protein